MAARNKQLDAFERELLENLETIELDNPGLDRLIDDLVARDAVPPNIGLTQRGTMNRPPLDGPDAD